MQCLSIEECTNSDALLTIPTLADLAAEVPRIYSGDLKKLDYEWRNIPNVHIPKEIKNSCNPETLFFYYLSHLTDDDGQPEFSVLPYFVLNILSLPTSNADTERIFSKLNLMKTKIRSTMSTATQKVLAMVSEVTKSMGGCLKFKPTASMIKSVQRTRTDKSSDNDKEVIE